MTTTGADSPMRSSLGMTMRNHNEYSYRLPTPPRVVVPPPTLSTDMPGLVVGTGSGGLDISFLKDMALEDIVQKNTLIDWAYERRRQAQMILPWLFLGPMVASKDKDFFARDGITMVLAIRSRDGSMSGALQAARDAGLTVATIEAPAYHDLIRRFGDTTRIINEHVAGVRQHALEKTGQPTLGKVLVFCESGNEKSAAVVAAYLMEILDNFDYIKAMQVCQAQRFCVNFDDTIKNILRSYWDVLQAARSVSSFNAQQYQVNNFAKFGQRASHLQPSSTVRSKRSIEDTRDDDDVAMEDSLDPSDALRFQGRDNTPFQNS
ncbi:phosphatases II [Macroventuria anomochaeta]|uniref:Phosphatases II n=1 Tax=Macroventuria anomochaeta TaxID=301207 RepID=A0ACB6S661_9PLEO|nr:phosphatases II [Macroventuria anomochaeta]KAF2629007.1 phosphatases II [Macroventuria anomochaeta]